MLKSKLYLFVCLIVVQATANICYAGVGQQQKGIGSCPPLFDSLVEKPKLEIELKNLLENNLRQALDPARSSEFRVEPSHALRSLELRSDLARVRFYLGRERLGEIDFGIYGETLRFDISLKSRAEGHGLYAGFLKILLKRFPFIRSVPAQMRTGRSVNANNFVLRGFGTREQLYELGGKLQKQRFSKSEALEFRVRILRAFYGTPAAKVRMGAEVSALQLLVVNPRLVDSEDFSQQTALDFIMNKGSRDDSQARVLVKMDRPRQFIEIGPDGNTQTVANPQDEFGEYDRIW